MNGSLYQCGRAFEMVTLQLNVSEISKRLRVSRTDGQLGLEFALRFVVSVRLPIEVAKAKVDLGFAGRNFDRILKFGNGFISTLKAIERLAHENMCRRGIGFLLHDFLELLFGTGVVFGIQATLSESLTQRDVFRLRSNQWFEISNCF